MVNLDRIKINPEVFQGQPCIRNLRFPVSKVLNLLAAGMTPGQIMEEYSFLEEEDIRQAIKYAAWIAQEKTVEIS